VISLYNRGGPFPRFVDRVGDIVSELLSGQPSVRVDHLADEDKKALAYPVFANNSIHGSYHCRLTAFPLPATAKDPFNGAASGDIHVRADGKGEFSQGTWEHRITAPNLNLTCKLRLTSGSYTMGPDGTGSENIKWELVKAESPRGCFQFFSPKLRVVTTETEFLATDRSGQVFYSTSLNPFAVLSTVCERDAKD
jgi:hypothetical protein